jgi:large subunit ribosomal protein L3
MRGMRMPGHMGQVQRTIQNLEIIQVREADNLLLIKGAVPGAKGDYVVIREAKKFSKVAAQAKREADAKADAKKEADTKKAAEAKKSDAKK